MNRAVQSGGELISKKFQPWRASFSLHRRQMNVPSPWDHLHQLLVSVPANL